MARQKSSKKSNTGNKKEFLSMTGFGHARGNAQGVVIDVEIKCVNHRFLDIALKIPRVYSEIEADIRKSLSQVFTRGRLEVSIQRAIDSNTTKQGTFNTQAFDRIYSEYDALFAAKKIYIGLTKQACSEIRARLASEVLRRPEVSISSRIEELGTAEKKSIFDIVQRAGLAAKAMRIREGQSLKREVLRLLNNLESHRKQLQSLAPDVVSAIGVRLAERIKKATADIEIDTSRVSQEVALLVDRSDVTEELTRIKSHLDQFGTLVIQDPNGKQFDFLIQELNREFTTLANKCQDSPMQQVVVKAKVDLEKLREQIQNIE